MKHSAYQKEWQDKVIHLQLFHQSKLREFPKWTITKTAKELHCSIGHVSNCLQLATWMKTHPKDISKFEFMHEALDWIKAKKRQIKLGL